MRSGGFECLRLADYAEIASEYYDLIRHPTCASLRMLSGAFLSPRILTLSEAERSLVEVGVGRSLLAPAWVARGGCPQQLTLLDSSSAMLAYSDEWRLAGAHLVLADACSLPFPDGSIDVIVASLGDPYNLPAFWGEVARVLRSGGRALFTAPASEWATRFRAPECLDAAEFIRRDGTILLMPSPVLTEQEQISMFAEAGLAFEEVQTFSAVDLGSTPAPKLLCLDEGEPVLRGYVVRR